MVCSDHIRKKIKIYLEKIVILLISLKKKQSFKFSIYKGNMPEQRSRLTDIFWLPMKRMLISDFLEGLCLYRVSRMNTGAARFDRP